MIKKNSIVLRKAEISDLERLQILKNNRDVNKLLGGFSLGYSKEDIRRWIEFHDNNNNEALYLIDYEGVVIGHVGLYNIDHRAQNAEFAIMIGDNSYIGKGIGSKVSKLMLKIGFEELNLHRIYLSVIDSNILAIKLYNSIGFKQEGVLRDAQFKNNQYLNLIIMSILRNEYEKIV
ncbi:GNAT family N-acetyltransferase [bacterium]|nr:GNAT family N-acetyltransferase [bacterium]